MNVYLNNEMFDIYRYNEYTWATKNSRFRRDTHNQIRFSINV